MMSDCVWFWMKVVHDSSWKSFENVCKDVSLNFDGTGRCGRYNKYLFFSLSVKNMEPSSTEGGAEETLLKNHPPSVVSAEIK